MIRKQQDLLRIPRVHGVRDRAYHEKCRAAVDRQVASLCRAVTAPMLGCNRGTPRQRNYLPQGVRAHHRTAESAGYPQTLLLWCALAPGWLAAH